MATGIYKHTYSDTSFYVGKSQNIEQRYKEHINKLKNSSHHNIKVQNKFDILGSPEVVVLEICELDDINTREEYWINRLDAINLGLNIKHTATGSSRGENNPNSYFSNEKIELCFLALVYTDFSYKHIGNTYEVSDSTVSNIAQCRTYVWLKEKYPTEYEVLLSKKGTRKNTSAKYRKY